MRALRASATRWLSLASPMTSLVTRMSLMPAATNGAASLTFWQHTPTAPNATWRRAISGHLCALAWARWRTVVPRSAAAMRSRLRSNASRSRTSAGVSIALTASPGRAALQGLMAGLSIDLRSRELDNLRPLRRLAARELAKLLRRARIGLCTERLEALAHRDARQRGANLGIESGHDLLRHAGGPDDSAPRHHLEAGHAGFGDGRDVRVSRRALAGGDAQRPHAPRLGLRTGHRRIDDHELDASADEVGDGRRRRLVGHMQHVGAGHELEKLSSQVRGGAVAIRGEGELARILLRIGDELGDAPHRQVVVDDQQIGHAQRVGDERESP